MERKSMGQFLAVLRKASGMTQQQVADRLHVSDKAVSRWERDACAPDLSLIPALAEMYGVTCDELLRGERTAVTAPVADGKADRQMRVLFNRSLAGFRTLCWVSLALSAVGYVCMLGISYGFYRPVIGFAVMLVLAVIAALLVVLAINRLKMVNEDNELFLRAAEEQRRAYARCLGEYSFAAFLGVLAAVVLSLPLVLVSSAHLAYSVLNAESYLPYAGGGVLLLALLWMKARPLYSAWVNGQPLSERRPLTLSGRMTLWQVGLTVAAVGLFAVAPYFETRPYTSSPLYIATNVVGLACLLANLLCFVVMAVRHQEERRALVLPGVRNMLYVVSALMAAGWHTMGFSSLTEDGLGAFQRYDFWDGSALLRAVGLALLVTAVFAVAKWLIQKRKR